mgnify:CR=1 FL=1
MKIPKFKVWDKHLNKMFPVGIIDYTIHSVYIKQPNGFYSERDFDRVELLQFTGRKDKTGKEVYEGDIVRFYDDYDEEYIASVVFIDCLGAYGVEWDGFQSSFDDINEYYSKDIEVIGNIYEAPELLEK